VYWIQLAQDMKDSKYLLTEIFNIAVTTTAAQSDK
jgi:hypothetical protein